MNIFSLCWSFFRKEAESFVISEHSEFSMLDMKLRRSLTNYKSRQTRGNYRNQRGRYEPYNRQPSYPQRYIIHSLFL